MKSYKIILFITAVFTMMGLIGYIIPDDGVNIGSINFIFPSPHDVMENNDKQNIRSLANFDEIFWGYKSIMKHIEQQKALEESKKTKHQAKLHKKVINHQYSPSYPQDKIEWIFPVFEALEGADKKKVRIIHYGDSQIEGDRMSNYLRAMIQNKFGGYGVGLVPAIQTIPSLSFGQKCTKSLTRYIVYGPKNLRMEERNYGPLGQTTRLSTPTTFTFYNPNYIKTRENTKYFNKITILLDEIEEEVYASLMVGDRQITKTANFNEHSIVFDLPDSTTEASILIHGKALIHGFMIDGSNTGVQFDNAAMRGCSGTIFTSINSESLYGYFSENNIPLIIMQFGGNSVPYTKSDKAIATYCNQLKRQIEYIHSVSPQSKILFIGPSDMSTNINGRMETYPYLPKLIDSLRNMCLQNDVAYWDLYKAMGGYNSMVEWVDARPQLAGSDHIHFTYTGSNRASEMLWEGLMEAYKLYTTKNDE